MNLCGYIDDDALRERLTLLAAKAGWTCWLCDDPQVLDRLLESLIPGPDIIVSDDPDALVGLAYPGSPLALLQSRPANHAVDSDLPVSTIIADEPDAEILQALQTCVNAHRFRDRFDELDRNEPITRLPRHEELFESLSAAKGRPMGLLVVQIDHAAHLYNNLDPVSKTDLLAAISAHIGKTLPATARLGFYDAACFVIALPDFIDAAVTQIAASLVSSLRAPLGFRGGELHLTVSIGCGFEALFSDPQRLWSGAWRAMRRAVERGGNQIQGLRDAGLSTRLPGALERDEFSLVLQPQLSMEGDRLTGAEALLRWQGMEVGELAPDHFIPVAEQRGHMARIGDWALDNACREAATWFEHLVEPLSLGVNISAQQFHNGAIVARIGRYRAEHWFDPTLLELELPHQAMLRLVDEHREQLYQLRDWGVRFALDNLGSSLIDTTKLLRCPADTLKIDRTLISRMETDPLAGELVAQICQLGSRFGLRVVAVGVERQSQQSALAAVGCTDIQGYLYSPPVSLDQFRTLLNQVPRLSQARS